MGKVRVYEIAREVGIESKLLVERLQEMGFEVKSHASALEEFEAREIVDRLRQERQANVVEKRVGSRVIRRRRKRVEPEPQQAPPEPAPQDAQEEEEQTAKPEISEQDTSEETGADTGIQGLKSSEADQEQPVQESASSDLAEQSDLTEQPAEEQAPESVDEIQQPSLSSGESSGDVLPPQQEASTKTEQASEKEPKTTGEKKKERPPKKGKKKKDDFYRAKVIRMATPPEAARIKKNKLPPPPEVESAKPSGIRVLKVVPGKEGRGNKFIDVSSKQDKRRRSNKSSKNEIRNALFDAFTPGYTPAVNRRRRMARGRGRGNKTQLTTPKALKRVIKVVGGKILTSELAKKMGIKLREVNRKLKDLGEELENLREDKMLELEIATMVAQEFEHEVQDVSFKENEILSGSEDKPEDLQPRPPVVTVMGHVDHGKTSILDAIRKTNVTEGEHGGITQHIGAYEVKLPDGEITFIDTPGHEAFTAMRARGASITDIVVLVVAVDDGIMPQTIEAINHSREAGVPIIVAINKMDLPDASPERIRQELTKYELVPEEWGGDTIITEVSAKTGQNLDQLLENILLQAEMIELKANPNTKASGHVVEARLDRGRGPVATLLVQNGTLKKGDTILVGTSFGRIRAMFNHAGEILQKATPGKPVQVQGLNEVPAAGEEFWAVKNERAAKKVIDHRKEQERLSKQGQTSRLSLEDFYEQLAGAEKLELKVVVKADVQGTAEAVKQALEKLSTDKVSVKVIHHGVGAISETDVNLASASNAILVGFNIRPDPNSKKLAQKLGLEIRVYNVIYDMTDDIRKAQQGLLPSTMKENIIGRAEVRDLFVVPKVGTVAGVSVTDGKMVRNANVRLLRDSVEVFDGKLSSLKRFKDDAREVQAGYECGIGLEGFNDIKRGDILEAYVLEEQRPSV